MPEKRRRGKYTGNTMWTIDGDRMIKVTVGPIDTAASGMIDVYEVRPETPYENSRLRLMYERGLFFSREECKANTTFRAKVREIKKLEDDMLSNLRLYCMATPSFMDRVEALLVDLRGREEMEKLNNALEGIC